MILDFEDVETLSPSALMAAVSEGPVSVGIDARSIGVQFYESGIIRECGTKVGHAALVIGYGSEDGTDFWLLKNSFGSDWGENGFFRILRTSEEGQEGTCGILKQPSYPVLV